MKKKLILSIGIIFSIVVLGVGIYHSDASQTGPNLSEDNIRQLVSEQYPGTITEIELEKDFNKVVYQVEVRNDEKKYQLELDGNSGEVLELKEKTIAKKDQLIVEDQEKIDHPTEEPAKEIVEKKDEDKSHDKIVTNNSNKTPEVEKKPKKQTVINTQSAINIALKEFPGKVTDVDLEEDDGRMIYEIEIESSKGEAEFKIDAYTGEVFVIEIDIDND